MQTWRDLWAFATEEVSSSHDARVLVEEAASSDLPWMLLTEQSATPEGIARLDQLVARRKAGEPLQYVVGRWQFRKLELHVDRRVLIPRFETEQVVQCALDVLRSRQVAGADVPVVLDLGTGSLAIALSIASEISEAEVIATDRSADALAVAVANLHSQPASLRLVERVQLLKSNWFESINKDLLGRFDLIVSNPPYCISIEGGGSMNDQVEQIVKDWEPHSALYAGADGLDDIRIIVAEAPKWLKANGVLIVELDPGQVDVVQELAHNSGFAEVDFGKDMTGRNRWLIATLNAH